ncbi:MAG: hypothetical protein AAF492_33660, partial [Verrucomicrobiota bacterium]
PIDRIDLARAICCIEPPEGDRKDACEKVPECTDNRHCKQPGKIGTCVNPGTADARCEHKDPIPFNLYVVRKPECPNCPTGPFITEMIKRFKGVKVMDAPVDSELGQQLVDELEITDVPFYALDIAATNAHRYADVTQWFEPKGAYLVRTGAKGPFSLVDPYMFVQPGFWDIGKIGVGETREQVFEITNLSAGDLDVRAVRSFFPDLDVILEDGPEELPQIRLRMTPEQAGTFRRYVWIESNDGGRPAVRLSVTGTARENPEETP